MGTLEVLPSYHASSVRTAPTGAIIPEEDEAVTVKVHVLHLQPGELAATHAGVCEEPEDRGVAAVLDAGALPQP
jgi:hypothetical protein